MEHCLVTVGRRLICACQKGVTGAYFLVREVLGRLVCTCEGGGRVKGKLLSGEGDWESRLAREGKIATGG